MRTKSQSREQDICFFISPIGMLGSPARRRADKLFREVVKPAADKAALDAVRGDSIERSGSIMSQVLEEIWQAPVCVADLHGFNPNVFYEVAFAHATRTPVVILMDAEDDIGLLPFDVRDQRVIWLSLQNEASIAQTADLVYRQLVEPPGSTPIADVFDLRRLEADLPATMARLFVLMREVRFLLRYQQAGPLKKLRMQFPRAYNKLPTRVREVLREEMQAARKDFGDAYRANGLGPAAFWTGAEFAGRCAWRGLNSVSALLELVSGPAERRPAPIELELAA